MTFKSAFTILSALAISSQGAPICIQGLTAIEEGTASFANFASREVADSTGVILASPRCLARKTGSSPIGYFTARPFAAANLLCKGQRRFAAATTLVLTAKKYEHV